MTVRALDVKTFSRILADLVNCTNGKVFEEWLREKLTVDSYDAINPHNTSRNEGYRAAFRDILSFIERGRVKDSYPERSEG